MVRRYQLPPWLLGNPTEIELYREAELIDLEDEIKNRESEPLPSVPAGVPPGAQLELAEE